MAGAAQKAYSQDKRPLTHPDVLEVLAVDRVDDAVGANQLDSTVNVDIYHRATLTVLGREERGIPQGCHRRPHPDSPYALHSPSKQLSSKQEWEHTG